jgi:hypothetical protein
MSTFRPNPFKTAARLSGINVFLKTANILARRPDLDMAVVTNVMSQNGALIAQRMIAAGVEAALELFPLKEPDNGQPKSDRADT